MPPVTSGTYDHLSTEVFLGGRPIAGTARHLEDDLRAAIDATLDMHVPVGVALPPPRDVVWRAIRSIVDAITPRHVDPTIDVPSPHEMLVGDTIV